MINTTRPARYENQLNGKPAQENYNYIVNERANKRVEIEIGPKEKKQIIVCIKELIKDAIRGI